METTPGTSISSSNKKRRIYVECTKDSQESTHSKEIVRPWNTNNSSRSLESDLRTLLSRKSKSTPRQRRYRHEENTVPRKRRLFFDVPMVPKYRDYQLLGDSQFVRFSEQILGQQASIFTKTHSRHIGYCVSGQKIEDLRTELAENDYNVHSNVLMMIGTNDILYRTDLQWMCSTYKNLLSNLLKKCDKIVLLTIPPVPKMEKLNSHWSTLERFNKFVQAQEDGKKVFVIDLGSLFISYNNTAVLEYYEEKFYPGERPDLIHLNLRGFKILKAALDILYFQDQNI